MTPAHQLANATRGTTNSVHRSAAPSTLLVRVFAPFRLDRLLKPSCSAVKNGTMTLRDRDTTEQLIGKMDEVIAVVEALCNAEIDWAAASERLEAYSGEQAM